MVRSSMTTQTPDAVREAIIAAITKADANFGYSYRLTKMDETNEEHTLFMDGFEPAVFQDREDGYPVIEQRRNAARTDAILAAFYERMFALDRIQIALIVSRFKAVPGDRCNLATRAAWNAALETADMILAAALDSRAGDAGEGVWRQTALDVAKDCQRVRHSSATPQERDTALRQAATMLRSFADAATRAPAVDATGVRPTCKTCDDRRTVTFAADTCQPERQGPCPVCVGTTIASLTVSPPAVDAVPAGEDVDDWLRGDWYERWQDATENADEELMATLKSLRGRVEQTIRAALSHGEGRK